MYQIRWSERATSEFEELLDYIARDNPASADLVKDRIQRALGRLEAFSLGTPSHKGTFKLYIPKTSYFVIFRRDDKGNIGIRAFAHVSRDWERINWENV